MSTTHKAEPSKIIFGAVFQGLSKQEYLNTLVSSRKVIPLSYEFYLQDYSFLIRSKIQEFLINISREIVKRTPRPSFQTILDTHSYIKDDLHLQKNSMIARDIQKYQVYTYSPEYNRLTYVLITTRNYRASPVHRLFLYLDQSFTQLHPELTTQLKLSETISESCEFPDLKEKIKTCQDQTKVDKVSEVQAKVDEVKGIMIKNIEDILERGEKLEDLLYKTEEVQSASVKFYKKSKKLNNCCTLL